jgi:hypothetical protein
MKAPRGGSTIRQTAYAQRVFGAQGVDKKSIALSVGYSPSCANSVKDHIENSEGFHNAMAKLANDSNNIALKVMEEFKARGFSNFSNKDLVGALNAIGQAWSKFNQLDPRKNSEPTPNRLRTIILQQVENQTVLQGENKPPVVVEQLKPEDDF